MGDQICGWESQHLRRVDVGTSSLSASAIKLRTFPYALNGLCVSGAVTVFEEMMTSSEIRSHPRSCC